MAVISSPSTPPQTARSSASPAWLWTTFVSLALLTIGIFFVPAFIIRPFRYQAPRALTLAMGLRQHAPVWTMITGVCAGIIAVALWRAASKFQKAALAVAMLLVAFSTVMARQNYFEWMFHPLPSADFEAAAKSKLDNNEMIMAVRFGDDARAYPIIQMAYHHILNDTVGGVPVAVTY